MDYEKKYKDALGWMKSLYDGLHGSTKEDAEHFFPELKENKDKRIRKEIIDFLRLPHPQFVGKRDHEKWIEWLEKQNKACKIAWHGISEEPREQEELLCEWDSDDAIWHDIVFYHADTKTFWNGELEIENVVRWAYLNEMLEPQSLQILANSAKTCKVEPKFKVGDIMRTLQEATDNITSGLPVIVSIDKEYYHCTNELIAIKEQDDYEYPPMNRTHNPTDKIEPKFQIGDWVVHDMSDGSKAIRQIVNMTDKSYVLDGEGYNTWYFNDLEDDFHLWTIDDAKFKVGDWITNDKGHSYLIAAIDNNRYLFEIGGYTHEQLNWEYIKNADNHYHLWTLDDAKDGDVLCAKYGGAKPFIFSENNYCSTYCALNSFGEFILEPADWLVKAGVSPATEEQCDTLFAKMKEAGYEWNDKKKELKKVDFQEIEVKNTAKNITTELLEKNGFELDTNSSEASDCYTLTKKDNKFRDNVDIDLMHYENPDTDWLLTIMFNDCEEELVKVISTVEELQQCIDVMNLELKIV